MYKVGGMGISGGLALVFILTIPRIFLSSPIGIITEAKGPSWLSVLIGGITALVPMLALAYLFKMVGGDLIDMAKRLLGKVGALIIALYLAGLFLLNGMLLLRQYAENTLLTALPGAEFSVVNILYAMVTGALAYFGIETIARACYVMIPFGVVSMLVVFGLLFPFYDLFNLAPWWGNGLGQTVWVGVKYAGMNSLALVLMLFAPAMRIAQNIQSSYCYGLGLSVVMKAATLLSFILVFDVAVGQEKILAFFEMTRLVYMSVYLQHIEALFIVLWAISGVFGIAASLYAGVYVIVRLTGLPSLRPLIPLTTVLLVALAMLPNDIAAVVALDGQFLMIYCNVGMYGIPLMLYAGFFYHWKRRGNRRCLGN